MEFNLNEHSHKRLNILTGEWVLVSPHRSKRPWQGKVEDDSSYIRKEYDPTCYLCPGNKRADGSINEAYTEPFAFTNDFSALLQHSPNGEFAVDDLLQAKSQQGICRVICFSPSHHLTLPQMTEEAILKVVQIWATEFESLAKNEWIKYIQIFENKGDVMGCSNPHPHGQIWSLNDIPSEIEKESTQQKKYLNKKGTSLLSDYLDLELKRNERIVCENNHFVGLVPFWAVWPYETMIISRRQVQYVTEFSSEEKASLASILKNLTIRYDNLFKTSFPYSAGMHQAPVNLGLYPEWSWHMHFYPPLLRSATVKKFMVGYEMLASPQRDISPEWAAEQLKKSPTIHYTELP